MSFVHPYMLLGLLFAVVPIILHLLARQQVRVHRFAAIEFIRRSNRKTRRRFRLQQFLLLLVRVGCVVAAALALSKPFIMSGGSGGDGKTSEVPVSTVLLIDNSRSMGFVSHRGTTLLDLAVHRAMGVVDSMTRDDDTAVMVAAGGGASPVPVLTFDRKVVKETLSSVRQSNRGANLAQSVGGAFEVLKESPHPVKRVVLFTDCTRSSWKTPGLELMTPDGVDLVLVDVAGGMDLWNRAIMGVRVAPAREQGPGVFKIEVDIANFSPYLEEELPVSIEVNGRVVNKGFVRLEPGGVATKTFYHTLYGAGSPAPGSSRSGDGTGSGSPGEGLEGLPPVRSDEGGWHSGRVIIPTDPLPSDNQWPFVLREEVKLRVLAINGEPNTIAREDGLFYLREVIAPARSRFQHGHVPMELKEVLPGGVGEVTLQDYHVVIMANVEGLDDGAIGDLERYVAQGGGLLITAGDNVDPAWYNSKMGNLLPRPLRGVQVWAGEEGGRDFGADRGESREAGPRLAMPHTGEPLWSFLRGEGAEGFLKTRFSKFLLLEPVGEGGGSALLQFENGLPILVEKEVGRGKVMVLGSTLDRGWTDMPIRPFYLPLVDRLCQRLGRLGGDQGVQTIKLGETVALGGIPARAGSRVRLRYPDGAGVVVPVQGEEAGDRSVVVESGDVPGVLVIEALGEGSGGLGGAGVDRMEPGSVLGAGVLVPDPLEADLTRLPDGVLASLSGGGRGRENLGDRGALLDEPAAGGSGYGPSPIHGEGEGARVGEVGVSAMTNLWPYALLLLLFLLVGEAILLSVGGGLGALFRGSNRSV